MTKKLNDAAETAAERGESTALQGNIGSPAHSGSGLYCYIGPNLKNLIQTGTIYRGTREEAYARAAGAIAAQPLVKTLIVSGDALPAARLRVKKPGNTLYANYQKLAGKEGK